VLNAVYHERWPFPLSFEQYRRQFQGVRSSYLFPGGKKMNALVALSPPPALVAVERASMRFLEFFAANIRNPHTRRAYAR
jgi:hypothetical protein